MKAFELMGWLDMPAGWHVRTSRTQYVQMAKKDGTLTPAGVVAIQDRLLGMFYWVTLSPNGRVRLRHISKKRPGKNHDSLTAALEWAVEQEGKTG